MTLIGQWTLQDNAASTTITAAVGSGMTAQANTSTLTTTGPGGLFAAGISFNGTSSFLSPVPAHNTFGGATESIMLRAKITDVTISTRKQVLVQTGGTTNGTSLVCFNSTIYYTNCQSSTAYSASFAAPDDGAWHHYGCVKVGGTLYLYMDGVLQATASVTGTSAGSSTGRVGHDGSSTRFSGGTTSTGTSYFAGAICDVRVYNSDQRSTVALIAIQQLSVAAPTWYSTETVKKLKPVPFSGVAISAAERVAYLKSLDSYRSTPIYVHAATQLTGNKSKPIVASRAMCANDGWAATPGQFGTAPVLPMSHRALITDPYIDLTITATASLSLPVSGGAFQSGTLTVHSIDRDLPSGFLIVSNNNGCYLQLRAAAVAGSATLFVRSTFTELGDVTVSAGHTFRPANGDYYQGGTSGVVLKDLVLLGDRDLTIGDSSLKYSCDGVRVNSIGARYQDLTIDNFNGHGLYAGFPLDPRTYDGSGTFPWDRPEVYIKDVSVLGCLAGVTVTSTDTIIDGIVVGGCRDYGFSITGSAAQMGRLHAYACAVGALLTCPNGNYIQHMETETCHYGAIIQAGAGVQQIGLLRSYGNTYCGVRLIGEVHIHSCWITHSSGSTNGGDIFPGFPEIWPTGYALVLGSFGHAHIGTLRIEAVNGASGMRIGQYTLNPALAGTEIAGGIVTGDTTSGAYGLHFPHPLGLSNIDLYVAGFANGAGTADVYFENGTGTNQGLTGNRFTFRGPSTSTVRWSDGTTGTFAMPKIPVGVDVSNDIQFRVS